jgi:hypothetical protein
MPKTPEGKDISSQNATKHGGRSNRLIVRGERQEDFDALRKKWIKEYLPENELEEELLERVIECDWLLKRAERNAIEADARLAEKEPGEESEADHKYLQLMLRYQTSRERSFYRAWRAFEQLRKDRIGEAAAMLRVEKQVNERPNDEEENDAGPSSVTPNATSIVVDKKPRNYSWNRAERTARGAFAKR